MQNFDYIIFLLKFKMTYKFIEKIKVAYPEPKNKIKTERTKRLRNINQVKRRLAVK